MVSIQRIWSREIIDSRGFPTLETAAQASSGQIAVASVPSAVTIRKYEAVELRDNDPKRYLGKGVLKAVENITLKIAPQLVGMDPTSQFDIDQKLIGLDGTSEKKNLGANAILSVSFAVLKLGAMELGLPLYKWVYQLSKVLGSVAAGGDLRVPTPIFNMMAGGAYGAGNLDFQEFQIIPASSKPFSTALRGGVEVYHKILEILKRRGAVHSVSDEGGYAPNLFTNVDALEVSVEAITGAGWQVGSDFFLGLDVAADNFYKGRRYSIKDQSQALSASSLISFFENLNKQYRLTIIEDPLQEDDWKGWSEIMNQLGSKALIVGDDLLSTNPERIKRASELQACNAIVVKPNQIGTVTETLNVIKQARMARWKVIVSHRAGETNDWLIADFGVGVKADYVKFGAPARGERVAKYNRLLNIEGELALEKKK